MKIDIWKSFRCDPPKFTAGGMHQLSRRKKIILGVIIAVVVVGLLIQLIPLPGRGNNPVGVLEPPWDSPEPRALAKRACLDCHSNE
jgi:hypothetical protein